MRIILLTGFLLLLGSVGQANAQSSSDDDFTLNTGPLRKGNFHVGFALNGTSKNQSDVSNILYTTIENKSGSVKTNFIVGYFIKENMSAGINYEFRRNKNHLYYSTSSSDTGLARGIELQNSVLGFLRNFVPLGGKRLVFFNDTKLGVAFSSGLDRSETNDGSIEKSYKKSTSFIVGISPGVMVFFTKNFAFETSIDFLGLEYTNSKVKNNEEAYGTSNVLDFNFKINLHKC